MQPQPQQQTPAGPASFLGVADLAARWRYTRQGVHKLCAVPGFPAPAFTLNAGRVRAWHLPEIAAFEQSHPELTSATEKHRKVVGYFRAVTKGQQGVQDDEQRSAAE